MEPTNNSASNLVSQEVFDDHLEKIVRDFHEFQGRMPGGTKLEDLIDMYINRGMNLPEDTNKSESTLLPHPVQTALQSSQGFNKERKITINEVTEDQSQNDTGNFPDSCPTVNTTISDVRAIGNTSRVKHIRYGDLKFPGVADGIIGGGLGCRAETVFYSVMKSFRTPSAGGKNNQQQAGVKENGNGNTSRNSNKRKHKQIMET